MRIVYALKQASCADRFKMKDCMVPFITPLLTFYLRVSHTTFYAKSLSDDASVLESRCRCLQFDGVCPRCISRIQMVSGTTSSSETSSGRTSPVSNTAATSFPAFIPDTATPITACREFLLNELSVTPLDDIEGYLWMAGLTADKIRPLHRQVVVSRKIVVCEQVHLHLVWRQGEIFVKPIPKCLLDQAFFENHIRLDPDLYKISMGFLSTYLRLIQHKSDFTIARKHKLVPSLTTWHAWLEFSQRLQAALTDPVTQRRIGFHGRYGRGELRLSRLNLIMQVFRPSRLVRGFIMLDTSYSAYFSQFLGAVVIAFVYVGTALAAFQVAMAPSIASHKLVSAGYWFAVVILLVLVCLAVIPIAWVILLTLDNLIFALKKKKST